jgi:cysteine desulfuration protein SufE
MSTPASLSRIVEKFQRATTPRKRHELLIAYAKRLPDLPAEEKTPENKVQGCTSQVFIHSELIDQKICYRGDSDSQLVKGLVAILVEGLSGLDPVEVLQTTPDFIHETGLNVSLTPSRSNGFYNIFQMMQQKALAHIQSQES